MYTGIVRGSFPIVSVKKSPDLLTYGVQLPDILLTDIMLGASVNIDGACQTVIRIDENILYFDASTETLRLTTLASLKQGDKVHVERSAKPSDENGGHLLSGHIDGKAKIKNIAKSANQTIITFQIPPAFRKYVFNKGFIGLHGCSLTVCDYDLDEGTFDVHMIPETIRLTTFGDKQINDDINLEIDRQSQVLVDTIERTLTRTLASTLEQSLNLRKDRPD